MYRTRQVRIRKKNPLRDYCAALCLGSAALYNRANFLIRQYATACRDLEEGKPLTGNQSEAFRMITEVTRGTRYEPKGRWLGYGQLDYILKRTEDPAYRALPAQANQQILKGLLRNYKSFLRHLRHTVSIRSVSREGPGCLDIRRKGRRVPPSSPTRSAGSGESGISVSPGQRRCWTWGRPRKEDGLKK